MNNNPVNDFLKKIFGNHALQENLRSFLEEFSIFETDATTESKTTKAIFKELKEDFPDATIKASHKLEGNFKLKIALEVDEQIGIEVKLANVLVKSPVNIMKFLGQAICLQKKYGSHFYIVIVGAEEMTQNPVIVELVNMLQNLKMTVFYIEWETNITEK